MIILLLTIIVALGLFYAILQLDISGTEKFFLVVVEMILVSQIFIKRYKMPSEIGLVLIKSKKGLEVIESFAKKKQLFNFMADVGNVMAYGLISRIVMKGGSVKSLITGLILLAFISFLVAPTAFVFLFQVIKIGDVEKTVSTLTDDADLGFIIISAILLLGGLALFMVSMIILYGGIILNAIIQTFVFGVDMVSDLVPGGTFLLPGINLPLFEGILALVVVLIVHEGAHAVLTRIAKIRLLSSGIVLFGIIPMGAFIEPDEKKLEELDELRQTRVIVAGPTFNLVTSLVSFVLFLGLAFLIKNYEIAENAIYGPVVNFIYITMGLVFSLNFIVGAVNLLPLPLFDGYRLVDINVKNKNIVKAMMYITLFFFIMNFVPWLFR